MKWYVISMQTATTGLICLRQFESGVFFLQIFTFKLVVCLQTEKDISLLNFKRIDRANHINARSFYFPQ